MTLCAAALLTAGVFSLPAPGADLLARIRADKTLTVATEARYAPFETVRDGNIIGYDVDLMNHILHKHLPGVRVKQLDLPFQGILAGLDARKFDLVITAVMVDRQRMARFAFTVPVAEATVALLKRENDTSLATLEDLDGKVVGSLAGSAHLRVLQAFNQRLLDGGRPGIKEIRQYIAFDEAYADLANKRLDGVAQSLANLGPLIKSRPGVFAVLQPMLGPTAYFGWAGRQDADSAALVQLFSDGIAEANRDGTLKRLQLTWFGAETALPHDAMPAPAL
ncbi:transporter substrate-binding domain-containing protein [Enterobacteriales bacterium SAP-6]|uniref:Transporter substrate-binding domain-containing protein n=2 Tax=Acerihabitans arboris TaxID=2691583 RepID=A0A845SGK8_9GAMM|nr:transporter substrate-binding domain-containing protein [Acerihabitans arboris]